MQASIDHCPLRDGNYQLMRNYLFAAAYARRRNIPLHGVASLAPAATSGLLRKQIARFQRDVLLPAHAASIAHATYEEYASALRGAGDEACRELAYFLEARIDTVLHA